MKVIFRFEGVAVERELDAVAFDQRLRVDIGGKKGRQISSQTLNTEDPENPFYVINLTGGS